MSRISTIIKNVKEPPKNSLWINDGVIKYWGNNGWISLTSVTDSSLEEVRKSLDELVSSIGEPDGIAPISSDGTISSEYLPSYVDDVVDVYAKYDTSSTGELENIELYYDEDYEEVVTPEKSKIYVDVSSDGNSFQFRWTGSRYVQVSSGSLILGDEEGTAYEGSKGKANEEAIASLQSLIVELHAVISFSSNRTVIYKGESDTVTLSHSATFNGEDLSYSITVDGSAIANPYVLEDSHTFTAVFHIDNDDPDIELDVTKTLAISAYYPRYYGYLASSTITAADVTTLAKQARSSSAAVSNLSVTFATAGYLWLCVPSGMTVSSVTSSGFAVPMEDPFIVEVTDKGDYLCYRSTNEANAGTVTYTIS